jgi:hypothetical protein
MFGDPHLQEEQKESDDIGRVNAMWVELAKRCDHTGDCATHAL